MILASLLAPRLGAFLLVGGGTTTPEMAKRFAELCGGFKRDVVVLGQASSNPLAAERSATFLRSQGFESVKSIADTNFSDIRRVEVEALISSAAGIWVPGGDQGKIVRAFGAQRGHDLFERAIQNGANWFGTTAGAMCVSDPMIGAESNEPGFGLIDILVDTRFMKRNREMRLKRAFLTNKHSLGLGLDEGEWVIIRDNNIEETHGNPRIMQREFRAKLTSK